MGTERRAVPREFSEPLSVACSVSVSSSGAPQCGNAIQNQPAPSVETMELATHITVESESESLNTPLLLSAFQSKQNKQCLSR